MNNKYIITGMTCAGCVAKVKYLLETVPRVKDAKIQLETPQGVLHFDQQLSLYELKEALRETPQYLIEELASSSARALAKETIPGRSWHVNNCSFYCRGKYIGSISLCRL